MTYDEAIHQLDQWISENSEISKIARRVKARLPDEDDLPVLRVEIENMRRYFKRDP